MDGGPGGRAGSVGMDAATCVPLSTCFEVSFGASLIRVGTAPTHNPVPCLRVCLHASPPAPLGSPVPPPHCLSLHLDAYSDDLRVRWAHLPSHSLWPRQPTQFWLSLSSAQQHAKGNLINVYDPDPFWDPDRGYNTWGISSSMVESVIAPSRPPP